MKYLVATFSIDCPDNLSQSCGEILADMAAEAGFEAFDEPVNGQMKGYVQEANFKPETLRETVAAFPIDGVGINYTIENAENKDWNSAWEDGGFEPINIQGRIMVYDAKHPENRLAKNENTISIGIEARQAFGTGTHETTRMMLSSLLELDLRGRRTLDCGCGTGILSIAASKLGARECAAYDIDEWSAENSRHNAALNDVGNITVMLGDSSVIERLGGGFDVVMANINRNILLADMPRFAGAMTTEGVLLISGFYEDDAPLLVEKGAELGLKEAARKTDNNWTCIKLSRNSN